jgi:hypothetical protein
MINIRQVMKLREACALLHSMVLSGEKHSETSMALYKEAMLTPEPEKRYRIVKTANQSSKFPYTESFVEIPSMCKQGAEESASKLNQFMGSQTPFFLKVEEESYEPRVIQRW